MPDSSALPFSKLDSAGRETLSAAAAAVTDKPAGSMISVRMKSPGCGGFFMGMSILPSPYSLNSGCPDAPIATDERNAEENGRCRDDAIRQIRDGIARDLPHHLHNLGIERGLFKNVIGIARRSSQIVESRGRHAVLFDQVDDLGQADWRQRDLLACRRGLIKEILRDR